MAIIQQREFTVGAHNYATKLCHNGLNFFSKGIFQLFIYAPTPKFISVFMTYLRIKKTTKQLKRAKFYSENQMFLVLFNSLLLAKKLHFKTKIHSKSDSFEDQLK